eukprot:TRINITY_DN16397_c0_g1_i1.p1 TRINITY_DN16397_c0_g1~~TRINITY_DN16397_c0_g1_i1.p1  ORF type:complete len:425 (-),score=51.09 TRINITY_DN16397_c0_g1_i1:348-1622(-)
MAPLRLTVGLAAIAQAAQVEPLHQGGASSSSDFDGFRSQHSREYAPGSEEYVTRKALFHERLALIEAHNSRSQGRLWTASLNKLVDRTEDELSRLCGWVNVPGSSGGGGGVSLLSSGVETVPGLHQLPEQVDWRSLSMAHAVPDQGQCGSCWAVSTASMLQGRSELQMKINRTFSAQQLVNCVANPHKCGGDGGCAGATVELAMAYIEEQGLKTEEELQYAGKDLSCEQPPSAALAQTSSPATKRRSGLSAAHGHVDGIVAASFIQLGAGRFTKKRGGSSLGLRGWNKLPENRALPLLHAASEGPLAISVAAGSWFWYGGGIFDGCSKDVVINHAVTLFGYGTEIKDDKPVAYWLVRNSWGKDWGENGFIRLFRHNKPEEDEAYCGTDSDPKAGLACAPYPKEVKVCGMCGMLYDSVAAHFSSS